MGIKSLHAPPVLLDPSDRTAPKISDRKYATLRRVDLTLYCTNKTGIKRRPQRKNKSQKDIVFVKNINTCHQARVAPCENCHYLGNSH